MRRLIAILGIIFLAAQAPAAEPPALKTPKEKTSYAVGVDIAASFKRIHIDANLDVDLVVKGLKDGLAGKGMLLSDKEVDEALAAFQAELRAKEEAKAAPAARGGAADANKKEGETFLAENKKKEGVVTLPSGLQYKILKAGTGKKPPPPTRSSATTAGPSSTAASSTAPIAGASRPSSASGASSPAGPRPSS